MSTAIAAAASVSPPPLLANGEGPSSSSAAASSVTRVNSKRKLSDSCTTATSNTPTITIPKPNENNISLTHQSQLKPTDGVLTNHNNSNSNSTVVHNVTPETGDENINVGDPLPTDLRRILMEVARTGQCTRLSWNTPRGGYQYETNPIIDEGVGGKGTSNMTATDGLTAPLLSKKCSSSNNKTTHHNFVTHRKSTTKSSSYHNNPSSSAVHTSAGGATTQPVRKKRRNGLHSSAISRRRYATAAATTTTTTTTTTTANADGTGGTTTITKGGALGGGVAGGTGGSSVLVPGGGGAGAGRKRPLFLIRTMSNSTTSSMFSAGSVGSRPTSGSEPEDSTQYECDSEGTSATTNSEFSAGEGRREALRNKRVTIQKGNKASGSSERSSAGPLGERSSAPKYRTLREAFRVALGLVLDHAYRYRGGYKLDTSELRRNAAFIAAMQQHSSSKQQQQIQTNNNIREMQLSCNKMPLSPDLAFQHRRKRLMALLRDRSGDNGSNQDSTLLEKTSGTSKKNSTTGVESDTSNTGVGRGGGSSSIISSKRNRLGPITDDSKDGPPFTIQRLAEVLVNPERYYTQTHKLCNCLEKLLLVTSSSDAFGGSTGGDTSQSRQEAQELAALADEKGRERRLRCRMSSVSSDDMAADTNDSQNRSRHSGASPTETMSNHDSSTKKTHSAATADNDDGETSSQREFLEAAARASLRSKFDHVAIDPHAASAAAELGGGRASSPPPPALNIPASELHAHVTGNHTAGLVRQHLQEHSASGSVVADLHADPMAHHHLLARAPSPILFSSGGDSGSPPGVNPLSPNSSMHLLQMHHAAALAGVASLGSAPLDIVIDRGTGTPASAPVTAETVAALDQQPGSASNSDIDSESDDISLDDSASDRSDGSDSGSGTAHYEPFTAARVMALNRMQQQQRLQSRASMPSSSAGGAGSHYGGEGFKPPADSEYQSGDSVDSMMAEDSGGSDSSSSDLAD